MQKKCVEVQRIWILLSSAVLLHSGSSTKIEMLNYRFMKNLRVKYYGVLQAMALPCFSTSFKGSTPGDRMKNMGVAALDSSKETAKSSDLPITYSPPSFSSTKSLQEGTWISSLQHILYSSLANRVQTLKNLNLLMVQRKLFKNRKSREMFFVLNIVWKSECWCFK